LIAAGLTGEDVTELGEMVSVGADGGVLGFGQRHGREVTIFKQVGIGLLDLGIANLVIDRAESLKLGTRIGTYDSL